MRLTDLETLKKYLEMKNSRVTDDDELNQLISGVSAQILTYIGRKVDVKERTERFDIEWAQRRFAVEAAPIHEMISVKNDRDRVFPSGSELPLNEISWQEKRRRKHGVFIIDGTILIGGPGSLEVTYVGGWAFDRDYYISRESDPSTLTPSVGDRFLIGKNPVGVFAGRESQVATWDGATWTFETGIDILRNLKPDLETATLVQSAYIFRTRRLQGTQQATFRSSSLMVRSIGLLNPTLDLIRPHQKKVSLN